MTPPFIIIIAGFIVGFLVGLTGMGGGALTTPFLILIVKINPVLAIGTDLFFAAITKLSGGLQHYHDHTTTLRPALWMAVGSLPAAWVGTQIVIRNAQNTHLTEVVLPKFLGGMLIVVGVIVIARVTRFLGPPGYVEVTWPHPVALIAIGGIGGFLVGITSIGGGTVIMALFLIFFSIPLNYMVGLDVIHGAFLTLPTAIPYALSGHVNWVIVGWLLLGSIPGAWLGAKAIQKFPRRLMRGLISILILGAGVQLLL